MEATALLLIQFDDSVDAISRDMFRHKFAEHRWCAHAGMNDCWTLDFESRNTPETMLHSVRLTLDLALQGARIDRGQVKAIVHFGPDDPLPA
jgi:hypothetical protein